MISPSTRPASRGAVFMNLWQEGINDDKYRIVQSHVYKF
jgi:hypothetical protein